MRRPVHRNFDIFSQFNYYVPDVAGLVILFVWFLVGSLLGNVVTTIFTLTLGYDAAMEYSTVVSYPLIFIPPMMYASIKSRSASYFGKGVKLDSDTHFAPLGLPLILLVLAVTTLAAGFATDIINSRLPQMPEWLEKVLKNMTQGKIWVNFLCVSVFAPFFEEWLCRGMVLRGLLYHTRKGGRQGISPAWAIVISAAFFAVIHLNPWQAVPAFILGCLFGYVYYRTGSLKLTMFMHFVNNTFALIMGNVEALKDMNCWTDVMPAVNYYITATACIFVVVLAVLMFRRIPLAGKQGNSDSVEGLMD